KEVKEERFREDLYYRLGVFPVFLPPLRERDEDVILLAEHFLGAAGGAEGFHNSALSALLAHNWPGNVRELQNVIQRGALLARGGVILPEHLSLEAGLSAVECREEIPPSDSEGFLTLQEMEKQHIKRALDLSSGKIYGSGGAAELLGMKPTTLQSRIKKLGLR
ncbi:MAG: helix-turn-helix domain-containing protein, partial [Spirochaetales bacterium]|nr:helix-turn-helix domain-containing protein [Spirochaetales bacterium]